MQEVKEFQLYFQISGLALVCIFSAALVLVVYFVQREQEERDTAGEAGEEGDWEDSNYEAASPAAHQYIKLAS